MARNWSRRALLASVGAMAFAGCPSDGQPATTPTASSPTDTPHPATTNQSASEPSTPTDTPTPADEHPPPRADAETPESVDTAWPMPDGDPGRSRARAAATGPIDPLGELWSVTAGAGLSGPVVADGAVFVGGDDGVVRTFDARTGDERWRKAVGAAVTAPWIREGTVYVPTADEVVALDADSGAIQWRASTPSRGEFLVADHGVYWLAERDSGLLVVDLRRRDGRERWRRNVDRCTRMPSHAFAGPEAVYVSTGPYNHLPTVIDADTGDLLGNPTSCGADFAGERCYRAGKILAVDGFFGRIEATPVDGGDGWDAGVPGGSHHGVCVGPERVYVDVASREDSGLFALNGADGHEEWRVDADWIALGRPILAGETLLVNTEAALRCFDPADGSERWTIASDGIGDGVAVAGDLVYSTDGTTVRAFRSVDTGP